MAPLLARGKMTSAAAASPNTAVSSTAKGRIGLR